MGLFLAIAVFAQASGQPYVPLANVIVKAEESAVDLAFSYACEDSARAMAWDIADRALKRRPGPPEPYASLIEALGARSWKAREATATSLRKALEADPAGWRWLVWGRRHRDPQIQLSSNTVLRQAFACATCNAPGGSRDHQCDACDGTGRTTSGSSVCRRCRGRGVAENTDWDTGPCWTCGGHGTLWPLGPWD